MFGSAISVIIVDLFLWLQLSIILTIDESDRKHIWSYHPSTIRKIDTLSQIESADNDSVTSVVCCIHQKICENVFQSKS